MGSASTSGTGATGPGGSDDARREGAPTPPVERAMTAWLKSHKRALSILGAAFLVALAWFVTNEVKMRGAMSGLSAQMARQQEALATLQGQVEKMENDVQSAKAALEGETTLIGRIAATYSPSVCLIEGTYHFVERGTGRVLREAQTPDGGITIFQGDTKFQVATEGTGPPVEQTIIGTGFMVARGLILTNLHVVRPWWKDETAEQILGHGFLPRMLVINAYFPSVSDAFRVEIIGASEDYDLALCRFNQGNLSVPIPALAKGAVELQVGQSVVLLGYPAGVDALLARLDESVAQEIVNSTSLRVPEVTRELANRRLIRPLPTQGYITALSPTRIVHDAATATGGSGGPLFNKTGVVIGVNYAVFTEFSASNFAVPVSVIHEFLRQQGIPAIKVG